MMVPVSEEHNCSCSCQLSELSIVRWDARAINYSLLVWENIRHGSVKCIDDVRVVNCPPTIYVLTLEINRLFVISALTRLATVQH